MQDYEASNVDSLKPLMLITRRALWRDELAKVAASPEVTSLLIA